MLNVELNRAAMLRMYIPASLDQTYVKAALLEAFGGYTAVPANGAWSEDAGEPIYEPVIIYEVVSPLKFTTIVAQACHIGQHFMLHNPEEQCFLAYVSGRQIKINRN